MGQLLTVDGFRFSQRQSLSRTVENIEIQISADNITWESVGDFTLGNVNTYLDINLDDSKAFRYFKFIAKTAHDGTNNAAMAEIVAYIIE